MILGSLSGSSMKLLESPQMEGYLNIPGEFWSWRFLEVLLLFFLKLKFHGRLFLVSGFQGGPKTQFYKNHSFLEYSMRPLKIPKSSIMSQSFEAVLDSLSPRTVGWLDAMRSNAQLYMEMEFGAASILATLSG